MSNHPVSASVPPNSAIIGTQCRAVLAVFRITDSIAEGEGVAFQFGKHWCWFSRYKNAWIGRTETITSTRLGGSSYAGKISWY